MKNSSAILQKRERGKAFAGLEKLKRTDMLFDNFCMGYFKPRNEEQEKLLEKFRQRRCCKSLPEDSISRSIEKTRAYTRTFYPPGWKYIEGNENPT